MRKRICKNRRSLFETLETRQLFAAAYPTALEQYMVELYNWARANPSAAVTKYGNVALNEGPPSTSISSAAKQPLAINLFLTDAARSYVQTILSTQEFSHYAGGTTPSGRMTSAGYSFGSSWGSGENAGMASSPMLSAAENIEWQFAQLYTDKTIPGRGHRVNMMNPSWKEVGSGIGTGSFQGGTPTFTVQDFAYSGTQSFLTGVAYTETSGNNFYTPGEQMGGVTITAIRSDGARFTTTTWDSGGYTLALGSGTYTVWGSGGSLGGYVKYSNVTIGSENVKKDFRPDYVNSSVGPDAPSLASYLKLASGKLTVTGTSGNDVIALSKSGDSLLITRNGETTEMDSSTVTAIAINAGDGNDKVTIGAGVIATSIRGGNGADSLVGGAGIDTINGDAGNDNIRGGSGNDKLYGSDGNDDMNGEAGHDYISGGNGNDRLWGYHNNDSLYGGVGNDSLWGQNNSDFLDGGTGADYMGGGSGTDTVDYSTRSNAVFVHVDGISSHATGNSGEAGELDNILSDVENMNGGKGNDQLYGSAANNCIRGNGGNDTIRAYAGADSLWGGLGDDRFYVEASIIDLVDGGGGNDMVTSEFFGV